MRKAAETPCKQRAFRDPPRTPAGPLPDPFPSNTPATRAAPATTNLEERLEHRASKRLGQSRDCTVGPGLPSPPVNALGASAGRRAGAPALAEALPSRLGGRRSDESEGKGFGKGGFDHSLVHFLLRGNGPSYGRTPFANSSQNDSLPDSGKKANPSSGHSWQLLAFSPLIIAESRPTLAP